VHVEILVQRLRVLHISGEGVHSVESAGVLVVPAGTQIIILCISVKMFACIKQRSRTACISRIAGKRYLDMNVEMENEDESADSKEKRIYKKKLLNRNFPIS